MMKKLFTLLLAAACLTSSGQVEYPYNPDFDADNVIGVQDMLGILPIFGADFFPETLSISDSSVLWCFQQLVEAVEEQQAMIEDLQNQLESLSDVYPPVGEIRTSQIPRDSVLFVYTYFDEDVADSVTVYDYRKFIIVPDSVNLLIIDEASFNNYETALCLNPNGSTNFSIVGSSHDGHYNPSMSYEFNPSTGEVYGPCGQSPTLRWEGGGSSLSDDGYQANYARGIIKVRYVESLDRWFYEM